MAEPGRRSLVGCGPWGSEQLDTTERLPFDFSLLCIGEGDGNPLQCSCLENPKVTLSHIKSLKPFHLLLRTTAHILELASQVLFSILIKAFIAYLHTLLDLSIVLKNGSYTLDTVKYSVTDRSSSFLSKPPYPFTVVNKFYFVIFLLLNLNLLEWLRK